MRFEDALVFVLGLVIGAMVAVVAQRLTTSAGSPLAAEVSRAPADAALEFVFDQIDIGVALFGPASTVTRFNRAAARLLQLDQAAAVGKSLMETFLDHRVAETAALARSQGSATTEITPHGQDERRLQLRLHASAGDQLLVLIEDVSELRRLQRIRSEFIDNLSHELRTPLTTIRLLTETLSQEVSGDDANVTPRMRERVAKIDVETGHLVQMVNELLDLSRIEGGAAELHLDRVRIPDVVDAALERLRTFADRQRVGLSADVDAPSLPAVWGDEERLGQVLVNLLHNALKFSPPDSVVTVSARADDDHIAVTVRDHGRGIARADLDRIFERFYKVDKARQRGQGGTGLGLSIARHIVEGHGGRIWAESEQGEGAAFTFTVPIAPS